MDKKYGAADILTLSTGEAIRMRPHLYFDKCFQEKTLDALPFEVLCHAFDEYFDGQCKKIDISITNDSFTVKYDAGISLAHQSGGLSKAEMIMTQIYACRNEKKHLAVGDEFCSIGMAIINFAAERCELTTACNGTQGYYVFENGITASGVVKHTEVQTDFTEIFVIPDKTIFNNLTFTFNGISEKVKQINAKLSDLTFIIHNNIKTIE